LVLDRDDQACHFDPFHADARPQGQQLVRDRRTALRRDYRISVEVGGAGQRALEGVQEAVGVVECCHPVGVDLVQSFAGFSVTFRLVRDRIGVGETDFVLG
jgi:hypothetical protein